MITCISDGAQFSPWTKLWLDIGEKLCILVFLPGWILLSALTDSCFAHGVNLEGLNQARGLLDYGPAVDELTLLSQGLPGGVLVGEFKTRRLTEGLLLASL